MKDQCNWMLNPEVCKVDLFVSHLTKQLRTTVLQLEARPRSKEGGCLQSGLVPDKELC